MVHPSHAEKRRFIYAALAFLAASLAFLIVRESTAFRTPLSVGATADEAWTYIHSPESRGRRGVFFDITRNAWKAQPRDIQCDVNYSLRARTNHLFATRHLVYLLDTNGVIVGTESQWKWIRPF